MLDDRSVREACALHRVRLWVLPKHLLCPPWFGAYAPSNQPEIVVVAFGENTGEHGGAMCGPMVLKVLETYFQHKYPGKYEKPQALNSVTKTGD